MPLFLSLARWLSVLAACVLVIAASTAVSTQMVGESRAAAMAADAAAEAAAETTVAAAEPSASDDPLPGDAIATAEGPDAATAPALADPDGVPLDRPVRLVVAEPAPPDAGAASVEAPVAPPPGLPPPAAGPGDLWRVSIDALNVRAGPSNTSPVIARVVLGQALTVHENSQGWLRIDLPQGGSGWVYNRYMTPQTGGAIPN
jgi:uncharacterized protein YgiM (DUF1202 family)